MTAADTLERFQWARDGQTTRRRARLTRMLQLVRLGHGRLTTARVTGLTGWTQRSAERYLVALWEVGLVDRHYRAQGCSHCWSITDRGLAELAGASGR